MSVSRSENWECLHKKYIIIVISNNIIRRQERIVYNIVVATVVGIIYIFRFKSMTNYVLVAPRLVIIYAINSMILSIVIIVIPKYIDFF